jgi:signal peptidase I
VIRFLLSRGVFIVETALLTVLITVGLQAFVAQPYRVERTSMLDTLEDGQMILVDKLGPRLTGYARGDIVVFQPPSTASDDGTPFIKRVVGLPGDAVDLVDGSVRINGVPLDESGYLYHGQPTLPVSDRSHWLVPAGMLFVMGDHRADSTDSRATALGPIPESSVIGRAVVRYWPLTALEMLGAPAYPELSGTAAAHGR